MPINLQTLYSKSLNLRAGECVSIFLGEIIQANKVHFVMEMESTPPKTLTLIAAVEHKPSASIVKHVRAAYERTEFKILNECDGAHEFDKVDISVPEDTQFHFAIYVNP